MNKGPLKKDERQSILEARLKSIGATGNKVLRGDQLDLKHKGFIPIGIPELDQAIGDIPGLANGSIVEFIGESSSGKTYTALKCAAEMHRKGKRVAFANIENSFYEPRAKALGVQTRNADLFELWENLGAGETWGEMVKASAASGEYGLIIIDSVTAMIPLADYNKSLQDEAKIGAHARMSSRLVQKLTEISGDTGTTIILINQFRYGAGAIKGTFAKKSTGGEGIGYYCHTRLVFSKINGAKGEVYNTKKEIIGGRSQVFGLKNRFGAPHFKVDFPIYFSLEESDPVIEFVMRSKAKFVELVKESKKEGLKYITEDGEVISSKSTKTFIELIKSQPAPEKRVKGDDSKTVFEYICRKINFGSVMIDRLNEKLENMNEDDVIPEVSLSDLSDLELQNTFSQDLEDFDPEDE